MREDEQVVGPQDPQAGRLEQITTFRSGQSDGVAIERNPFHYQTGSRIPGIVLP